MDTAGAIGSNLFMRANWFSFLTDAASADEVANFVGFRGRNRAKVFAENPVCSNVDVRLLSGLFGALNIFTVFRWIVS